MNWNIIKQSYTETGMPIIIPKYPDITLTEEEQKTFDNVIKSQKISGIETLIFIIFEFMGLFFVLFCKGIEPLEFLGLGLVLLGAIIMCIFSIVATKIAKIPKLKEKNLGTYCLLHCTLPILNRFVSDIEVGDGVHMIPGLGTFSDNKKEMKKELVAERLIPQCKRFTSSVSLDTLKTNKQGVYYSDIQAYKIVHRNKHMREKCIYDGSIIVCRTNKPVSSKITIVTTKYIEPGKESSQYLPVKEKINTGYGQFDDNFDICADSQREALEILTHETMKELLYFKAKHPYFCMILIEDYIILSADQTKYYFKHLDKNDPVQNICDDFRKLLNITQTCRKIFE